MTAKGHSSSERGAFLAHAKARDHVSVSLAKLVLVAIAGLFSTAALSQPSPPPLRPFVETAHEVERPDPYRWMENGGDTFDDWVRQEADWARSVLDAIPSRAALFAQIEELDRPSAGVTSLQVRSGRWLYDTLADGASSRSSVVRLGETGEEILNLLDLLPKEQGPWSEVRHARVLSPDGRYLAFGTTRAGEANPVIRIFEVQTGRLFPDVIAWPLWADSQGFRPRWLADSSGFFYVRNPRADAAIDSRERARGGQIFLHRLGTPAAEDRPIFGYGIANGIEATDTLYVDGEPDARWLSLLNRKPAGRDIWVMDLGSLTTGVPKAWRAYRSDELVPGGGVYNGKLCTLDAAGAERYRVVSIDLGNPNPRPVEVSTSWKGCLGIYRSAQMGFTLLRRGSAKTGFTSLAKGGTAHRSSCRIGGVGRSRARREGRRARNG